MTLIALDLGATKLASAHFTAEGDPTDKREAALQGRRPFEAAGARLELARALLAVGRTEPATTQARQALELFQRLGAARGAESAQRLLDEIASAESTRSVQPAKTLTRRQVEVLRLVAQGLGNRDIGTRLGLSEFTIRRHLANIYTRLGVSSRAAAVANALRDGML